MKPHAIHHLSLQILTGLIALTCTLTPMIAEPPDRAERAPQAADPEDLATKPSTSAKPTVRPTLYQFRLYGKRSQGGYFFEGHTYQKKIFPRFNTSQAPSHFRISRGQEIARDVTWRRWPVDGTPPPINIAPSSSTQSLSLTGQVRFGSRESAQYTATISYTEPPQITQLSVVNFPSLDPAIVRLRMTWSGPASHYQMGPTPSTNYRPIWIGSPSVFQVELPGSGTYEVMAVLKHQMPDAPAVSFVTAPTTLTLTVPSAPVVPVQYIRENAAADEVVRYAVSRGFGFYQTPMTPRTRCMYLGMQDIPPVSRLTLSSQNALQRFGGGVCRFHLFGDKSLRAGWRVVDMALDLTSFSQDPELVGTFVELPDSPPNADVQVRVVYANEGYGVTLRQIVLEGPPDADWQEAFHD